MEIYQKQREVGSQVNTSFLVLFSCRKNQLLIVNRSQQRTITEKHCNFEIYWTWGHTFGLVLWYLFNRINFSYHLKDLLKNFLNKARSRFWKFFQVESILEKQDHEHNYEKSSTILQHLDKFSLIEHYISQIEESLQFIVEKLDKK